MSKSHKGLPADSQAWADEVDALMAEVKQLREVVKRLSANAGIDYSNPNRGVNTGDTPSVKNPVGQKLSSLADTDIYNVADKQVLTWNQKDQKWLPATPATGGGGTVDISAVSYAKLTQGYGNVTSSTNYAYTAARSNTANGGIVEIWATDYIYIGQSNTPFQKAAIIQLSRGGFDPWVSMMSANCELLVVDNNVSVSGGTFSLDIVSTASRPSMLSYNKGAAVYDATINKPIWWDGTSWRDALGNAV